MRYLCSSSLPLYKGARLVRVFLHRPSGYSFPLLPPLVILLRLSYIPLLYSRSSSCPHHQDSCYSSRWLNCIPTPSIRTFIHPPSFVVVALLFIPVVRGEADIYFPPSSSSLVPLHCRLHQSSPLASIHAFNASQLLSNRSSHWMQACLSIFCCSTS